MLLFYLTEDEQRKNMGSQKSVQQLITERDQALSDLNSVERSLSDLFRRYENMKTVLEGFKKVNVSHTDEEIHFTTHSLPLLCLG